MKIASIIGMIVNFYLVGTNWLSCIGILMLFSLLSDKKCILFGILGLVFTGLLGGIFYLCWQPEEEAQ